MSKPYAPSGLGRAEVDALPGATVLDFGTNWCERCQAAQPLVDAALAGAVVRQLKIEDGKGLPLGRSYAVRLWPTLIFLCDGREVARLVRPGSEAEIRQALNAIGA